MTLRRPSHCSHEGSFSLLAAFATCVFVTMALPSAAFSQQKNAMPSSPGSNQEGKVAPTVSAEALATVEASKIAASQAKANAETQATSVRDAAGIAAAQADKTKWYIVAPGVGALLGGVLVLIASELRRKSDQTQFRIKLEDDQVHAELERRDTRFTDIQNRLISPISTEAINALHSMVDIALQPDPGTAATGGASSTHAFFSPVVRRTATLLAHAPNAELRDAAIVAARTLMRFACSGHSATNEGQAPSAMRDFVVETLVDANRAAKRAWVCSFAHYAVMQWEIEGKVAEDFDEEEPKLFAVQIANGEDSGENSYGEVVTYPVYRSGNESIWVWTELYALCPFMQVNLNWPYSRRKDQKPKEALSRVFHRASQEPMFRQIAASRPGILNAMTEEQKAEEKARCRRDLAQSAQQLMSTRDALVVALMEMAPWPLGSDLEQEAGQRFSLDGVFLTGATISSWPAQSSSLRRSEMSGCVMSDCDFSRSDLSGAFLECAKVSECDLREACLAHADLRNAQISGYMEGASRHGALDDGAAITEQERPEQDGSNG